MNVRMIVVLGLAACGVQGSGVEATEVRDVAPFLAVSNEFSADVDVIAGEVQEVVVTCDDNLIDLILTEVVNGELRIRTEPNHAIRPRATCVIEVTAVGLIGVTGSGSGHTMATGPLPALQVAKVSGSGELMVDGALPSLAELDVSGSGSLIVRGIDAGALSLDSSGSGHIEATGKANVVDADSSGSGGISAKGLSAEVADIRVSGSGSVELTVTDAVDVDVSGSGGVTLYGHPDVTKKTSGSGNVVVK